MSFVGKPAGDRASMIASKGHTSSHWPQVKQSSVTL
ncbi:MAG: hypothetical protein JJLCMIEE_03620 [Acidimicrobiales bacterium]|nr:hypothetical protein [Acidimicrobiales bacterium]